MEKDLKNARKVVAKEKKSILELEKRFLDKDFQSNFQKAIDIIYKCRGKIVVSGMGKSGIIAQKIVATFNSTGTQSVFLHSADSIHGDIGIVEDDDVVILITKSGNTPEVKNLMPIFRSMGVKIILLTGNPESSAADMSDSVIDCSVKEEACPHNLAPTSSSTVTLVTGDALAVSLLQKKRFTKEDFASLHPGGVLGKKLLLRVDDIMVKGEDIPVVMPRTKMKDVIYQISSKRLGCAIVLNKSKVEGIITDGDIRRFLEGNLNISSTIASEIMNKSPKFISTGTLAKTALEIMEKNKITQLIILNKSKKLEGLIHIHTLVELGL